MIRFHTDKIGVGCLLLSMHCECTDGSFNNQIVNIIIPVIYISYQIIPSVLLEFHHVLCHLAVVILFEFMAAKQKTF